jgi:hypothetical protein
VFTSPKYKHSKWDQVDSVAPKKLSEFDYLTQSEVQTLRTYELNEYSLARSQNYVQTIPSLEVSKIHLKIYTFLQNHGWPFEEKFGYFKEIRRLGVIPHYSSASPPRKKPRIEDFA